MDQSLFGALTSYIPTANRDPEEDYLTQLFAWLLSNVDGYAEKYVEYLWRKILNNNPSAGDCPEGDITINTQERIPVGRVDLIIRVKDGPVFICEHKVRSELSENQIGKYMDYYNNEKPGEYHSILVTQNRSQHKQNPEVAITWEDVYKFTEDLLLNCEQENGDRFVLEQFLKYLKEDVMEFFEPIKQDTLERYWDTMNIEKSLETLFRRIAASSWESEFPDLSDFPQLKLSPTFKKLRWGRIGIEFFEEWKPGIFAGVLLDTSDHHIEPVDKEKGPDFVVLLEGIPKSDEYNKIITSDWYADKCRELGTNSGDFEFMPVVQKSPWRIIVLHRSLSDILAGKKTKEEQEDALIEAIKEGLKLLSD